MQNQIEGVLIVVVSHEGSSISTEKLLSRYSDFQPKLDKYGYTKEINQKLIEQGVYRIDDENVSTTFINISKK